MTDQTNLNTDNSTDFVTWDDLSTVKTTRLPLAKYGGKIVEFLNYIPLEDMAELQAKFMANNRKDYLGFSTAVLKYVMVNPPLKTDESVRAARKADSGVLLEIIGRVTSTQLAQEINDNLGND